MIRAIVYLLAITLAELIVVILEPATGIVNASLVGMAIHLLVLVAAMVDAARMDSYRYSRLALALALVPLIRIISLSMPLASIPRIWQFPIIYLPLLLAAIAVVRQTDYGPRDVGFRWGNIPVQIGVGLLGLGLGIVEYYILVVLPAQPIEILNIEPTLAAAWLPALVLLLSTGLVEEFIFRGVLQKAATDLFGNWGIVYVSLLFAVLHIGFLSWLDVIFVFAVAMFFGYVVKRTGSLLGVTLCHGIINIMLFIAAPVFL